MSRRKAGAPVFGVRPPRGPSSFKRGTHDATASVEAIWQRLLIVFVTLLVVCVALFYMGGDARVPALVLLAGNVGAYVGVPRSLGELKDQEVIDLGDSWLAQ